MTKPTVTEQMVEAAIAAKALYWFEPPAQNISEGEAMRAAITAAIEASGILEENARLRVYFTETGRILRNAVVKEDGPSIFIIAGKEHRGKFMDKVYPFLMDMQEQCQQALNKEPTP
jgi:hypothetical protein